LIYNTVGGGNIAGVNVAAIWALIVLVVLQLIVFETLLEIESWLSAEMPLQDQGAQPR